MVKWKFGSLRRQGLKWWKRHMAEQDYFISPSNSETRCPPTLPSCTTDETVSNNTAEEIQDQISAEQMGRHSRNISFTNTDHGTQTSPTARYSEELRKRKSHDSQLVYEDVTVNLLLEIDNELAQLMIRCLQGERKLRKAERQLLGRHDYLEKLHDQCQSKMQKLTDVLNEAGKTPKDPMSIWQGRNLGPRWYELEKACHAIRKENVGLKQTFDELQLAQRPLNSMLAEAFEERLIPLGLIESIEADSLEQDVGSNPPFDLDLLEDLLGPAEEQLDEFRPKEKETTLRRTDPVCEWLHMNWELDAVEEAFVYYRAHGSDRLAQWQDDLEQGNEEVPQTRSEFDRFEIVQYGRLAAGLAQQQAEADEKLEIYHQEGQYPEDDYPDEDAYAPGKEEAFDARCCALVDRGKIKKWLSETRSVVSEQGEQEMEIDVWDFRSIIDGDSVSCYEGDAWTRTAIDDWRGRCEEIRISQLQANIEEAEKHESW